MRSHRVLGLRKRGFGSPLRGILLGLVLGALANPTAWSAPAEYVIHISFDGLRGDLLGAALGRDGGRTLPGFRRLVTEGASTFDARSDFTLTNTLPNHTCMLTGRPAEQPAGQPATVHHGWVWNSKPKPDEVLHGRGNTAVAYVASVFDVVHDAGLSTAAYVSKSKFVLFDRSWDESHGAPDTLASDNGRDKIDRYVYVKAEGDAAQGMQAALLADLRARPARYTFVHYLDLDAAGHDMGWESDAWREVLERVDGYLVEVLAVVDSTPSLAGRTAIVVSADHGGAGDSHGDATLLADCTVPFLVWGPGVAPGHDLYALNSGTRAAPGSARPDYNAVPQPIRNGDAANLALDLLGLGPVPGSTINARQDLRVSRMDSHSE